MRLSVDRDRDSRESESLGRGCEVNRFVVLGLVGRGAMGDVYAAHDPELDRKVAIKLLRARGAQDGGGGTIADEGPTRLIREAQAIAKVSHPNVVVVYDVGTFEGRVFIAMEFIEGHTLGYWMVAEPRSADQVLDVFAAAGRGLGAAHEKDLVHRDFKPDNVMVSGDGQVRVMDFGLARMGIDRDRRAGDQTPVPRPPLWSAGDAADDPLSTYVLGGGGPPPSALAAITAGSEVLSLNITRAGSLMGTPAYMSPEQFRGEPADARSDQFSFCVALYEALYGERPFSGQSVPELAANVTAGNARRLPPAQAAGRAGAAVHRALLRGISSDPAARFPSMGALLAEVRPVSAAASVTRRFREGAAAKLSGIWEAPPEPGATPGAPVETEAKAAVRRAFLATGKPYAAAVFDAVNRILDRFARRWTEIYVDACEATHVRGEQSTETLDLRMSALDDAVGDLGALGRQFRQATADTVENAVNAAGALGTLERCADVKLLRAIVRPPDDPATRAVVDDLRGRLSEVRALARVGRVADGLKAAVALEGDARRTGYAPLLAEVLFACGMIHAHVADIAAAARTLEDAVWTAELCRHDQVVAEAAANLVFLTGHAQSRFDAGEIWSRHAETVLRRMGGHDQIRGWLFNNRGAMRATQGRLQDAVEDVRLAIAAKERALGPLDPDVGISLANAAIYLDELGETEPAAACAGRALEILQAALGLEHPSVAIVRANHAEVLIRLGRFGEAHEEALRALAILERETDPQGLYVTYPLAALGLGHIAAGRFEEAVATLERAVRIREAKESLPSKLAEVHFALGRALWGRGRPEDSARALALAARALQEYGDAPATPATRRGQAEIESWLGTHRPAA